MCMTTEPLVCDHATSSCTTCLSQRAASVRSVTVKCVVGDISGANLSPCALETFYDAGGPRLGPLFVFDGDSALIVVTCIPCHA